MSNYGHKIGHQACPSCPSHDAFYVYKDGHGHCYSCGYHDSGTKSIESMKRKLNKEDLSSDLYSIIDTSSYSHDIPKIALSWLKKYDITDDEIRKYDLMWNEKGESLVFPLKDYRGEIFATNERYFGTSTEHPKYLTKGNKTKTPHFMGRWGLAMGRWGLALIVVEDFVSAMKVGRQYNVVPLIGTTIPDSYLINFGRTYKGIVVWLDPDKKQESLFQMAKASQYLGSSFVVFSNKDPKYYTNTQIRKHIDEIYDRTWELISKPNV